MKVLGPHSIVVAFVASSANGWTSHSQCSRRDLFGAVGSVGFGVLIQPQVVVAAEDMAVAPVELSATGDAKKVCAFPSLFFVSFGARIWTFPTHQMLVRHCCTTLCL